MQNLLSEHPVLLCLMLGVTAFAFLYAWVQTGKKLLGIIGLVFLALVPAAFYVSSNWETDREIITRVIHETAEAVAANDHQRAVSAISDPETKARALSEMPNYRFDRVKVSQVQITMVSGSQPMEADVDANVMAVVSSARSAQFQDMRVPRRLFLRFRKEDDGQWKMIDYAHTPLNGKPDMFSTMR